MSYFTRIRMKSPLSLISLSFSNRDKKESGIRYFRWCSGTCMYEDRFVYYCEVQRLSTFSFTFSLLYSVFVSRPGFSIFFAAAFPPACILSAASFASSSIFDIYKYNMHFIEDKESSCVLRENAD